MLAVFLSALVVAPAGAQAPDTQSYDDPLGDVEFRYEDQTQPAQGDWSDVDLLEFWIGNETADSVSLGLRLDSWDRPIRPPTFGGSLNIDFSIGGQPYRLTFFTSPCNDVSPPSNDAAQLQIFNAATDFYEDIACVPAVLDEDLAHVEAVVPKALITDIHGLPARAGLTIDAGQARARETLSTSVIFRDLPTSAHAVDVAPDEPAPSFLLKVSKVPDSSIVLSSPAPVRFSNGGTTALAFQVNIDNLAESSQEVFLEVRDLPESWKAKLPPRVQVDAGKSVLVPVIVSTQFGHNHGTLETFRVVATSSSGVDVDLELGMLFPDIAQPAGHHDLVYLHSAPEGQTSLAGWANTATDDASATDDPVAPDGVAYTFDPVPTHRWHFPFKPPMLMGLDFDLQRQGTWHLAMQSGAPDPAAELTAKVLYCRPGSEEGVDGGRFGCDRGSWIELASAAQTLNVGAQERVDVDFELVFDEIADVIHYEPSSNLMFRVEYFTTDPFALASAAVDPLVIVEDNEILLPLVEYVEPIDQAFAAIGDLQIESMSGFDKQVNPGKTTVFHFVARNTGSASKDVRFLAEGANADWATWNRQKATLGPGDEVLAALAITAPAGASEGSVADLFAIVENEDDPLDMAMGRVRAFVTTAESIANEEAPGVEGKKTPGLPWLFVLAALAAGTARRKHD